jgi:FG-GAP-like repeat/IPT/TIG domain
MRLLSLLFTVVVSVVAFAQVPTITSFSPTSGPVGTTVTITGTGFDATASNNAVYFGAIKGSVISASTTSITVTVPAGAGTNQLQYSNVNTKLSCITGSPFVISYTANPAFNSSSYNTNFALGQGFNSAPGDSFDIFDVNNDGKVDIVYQGLSGSTQSFRSLNNSSTSSSPVTSSTLTDASIVSWVGNQDGSGPVVTADFNGDGLVDFNCVSIGSSGTTMIRQTSSGVFAAEGISSVTSLNSSPRLIDFTKDGKIDIFSGYFHPSINFTKHNNTTNLSANPNVISMTFQEGAFNMGASTHFGSCSMDFDNNGYLDPAIYTSGLGIIVRPNSATGFGTNVTLTSESTSDVFATDFDSDGKVDIICAGSGKIQVFRNTSSGSGAISFASVANFSIGNSNAVNAIEIVDMNNDGKPDVVALQSSAIFLFTNATVSAGSISFGTATQIASAGNSSKDLALSDLNNDGIPEMIVSGGQVSLFTYTAPTITATPNALSSFSTCAGTVSTSQTTSISGTGLSANITLTAPTGYEISLSSASGYASTLTLTQSGGVVNATTIYVRLNSTATAGTYNATLTAASGSNSASIALSGTVNTTTITTQPTTTPIVICHNSTPQSLSVATSATSPTYLWQQSTNGTSGWVDATTAAGYQSATMSPSHTEINYGVRYYRCIVTSNGCSTTSNASASYSIANFSQSVQPSTTAQNICINGSATQLSVTASNMGLPITYTWQRSTTAGGSYSNAPNNSGTNTYTPPTNTAGTYYYRCYYNFCGGWSQASSASGAITVTDTYTWTGATSTDPSVAGNWNPAAVPCSGANEVIPSGLTNYPEYTNLTINAGTTLTVNTGGRLTVTGTLTNNGTMTIESGATFLQGTSLAGSGTYNVKQAVTGAGGSTPTGRFWYMGLPINNLTRGTAFGAASGANRLWSWSESAQAWSSQITDATTLTPTTGYVFRTGADVTLNFSGTSLYSANTTTSGLTNSGGSFGGCHLFSNPYTAYLDWHNVHGSGVSTTYCVRSYNTTSSTMVYDTYNTTGTVAVQNSSYAVTRYIAPMQSFWVRVDPNTTGTVTISKTNLTHQPTATGLKDITSFPAFARLNLVDGTFSDQVVVYTDVNANADIEDYDSKKFFLPNVAQVYCPVGNDKLVINALKKGKAITSAPLTVELPSTKVYKFEMAESFVENGLVILEDRQEGIFQDMGVNPTYEFYGNSGVVADRFVLHFQLPNGTNNEGQAGVEDLTSAQIDVISNQQGEILVSLSSDLTATGNIQILDAAGRLIQTTAIKGQDTKLQITEGTGVYFVRVTTPMKSETKKVLVY